MGSLRYAAVGGDSGFEAGELCFIFGGEIGVTCEGEKTKIINPTASRVASISVIGFERRIERGIAMVKIRKGCRG